MGLRTRLMKRLSRMLGMPRAYGAGRLLGNRLLSEMPGLTSSPDSELRGGLREWRAKSRWQELSNPYCRQIKRTLQTNLVGPNGIQLRGNVLLDYGATPYAPSASQETAKDPERNRLIEQAWERFCQADSFDLSGQRSFHQFELAIVGAFPAFGGAMVRICREQAGRSQVPVCFELISCEQLDEQFTGQSDIPGRSWRMGVEHDDRTGRRTRYAILSVHPGDSGFTRSTVDLNVHTYVDAADIIHVFLPEEIGQTREMPWLLPVLTTVGHVADYEKAHWTRKKASNNLLGFIQKPEPDAPGMLDSGSSLASETDPTTGEIISRSAPGQWIELLPGEVPVPPNFGPDDNMYPQVLKTMLRRMAAGSGLSYQVLSKDFSDTNYSSARMSELQDRDGWRCLQRQLITIFHQRVFEEWLGAAIMSGELPIELFGDYYTDPHKYLHPRWIPRSWSFVDPNKEMQAYQLARDLGLQSAGDQIAEIYGNDLEAVWAQIAYEKDLAEQLGIELGKKDQPPAMPMAPEQKPVEDPEEEPEQEAEPDQ